jgi:hypothetical protein
MSSEAEVEACKASTASTASTVVKRWSTTFTLAQLGVTEPEPAVHGEGEKGQSAVLVRFSAQ